MRRSRRRSKRKRGIDDGDGDNDETSRSDETLKILDDRDWSTILGNTSSTSVTILERLSEDGYVDVSSHLLPEEKDLEVLRHCIDKTISKLKELKLHTMRTALNLPARRIKRVLRILLRSKETRAILGHYLYSKSWKLIGAQTIVVRPKLKVQKFHRDHSLGAGQSIVLALSVDDVPLRTLFVPGTHVDHGTDKAHGRDLDLVQRKRLDRSKPVEGRMMFYDPYVVHAGGLNPDDKCYRRRLFITFASSDLGKEDIRDIKMTNNLDAYRDFSESEILRIIGLGDS